MTLPNAARRRALRAYRPPRTYSRGDRADMRSPLRTNSPDGALLTPMFWQGYDNIPATDWAAYGGPVPPFNTSAIGGRGEWGGVLTGAALTSQGILPAVTRALSLIAGPVVRTTWRFYTGDTPAYSDVRLGLEETARPLWVVDPQLVGRIPGGEVGRPVLPRARRLGPHDFWKTLLSHAILWGHAGLLYVEDATGQPLAGTLRVVHPARWGVTEDGRYVLGDFGDAEEEPIESDYDGCFDVGGVKWCFRTLHGFAPQDGSMPEGALTRSGLILSTGAKMNSYLHSILGSGVPSGVLRVATPNYPEAAAQQLKKQWMDAHGGEKKSVAILSAGIDFTPLQLNVVDSDVVRAKGALLVDIAHSFGLPAAMLDAAAGTGSNLTYSNLSDKRREFLDHSLADWSRGLEDLISALLPYGTRMSIDWTGYLATDPTQMVPYVTAGVTGGWLTINEARDVLRLTPLMDTDETAGGTDDE